MQDKKIDKGILCDAVICNERDNVLKVSRIIRDTKARHLIVVDKNLKPLGIISPFDINNRVVAEKKNPDNILAKQIMTTPVETIDLNSTYSQAAEKMASLEAFTMPVVKNGKLVGVLDYSAVFKNICELKHDKK